MPSKAVSGSCVVVVALIAAAGAGVPCGGGDLPPPPQALEVVDGPCIQFDRTRIDFGVVTDEVPLVARFRFTNVGNRTLVLDLPHTSCNCIHPFVHRIGEVPDIGYP